MSKFVCLLGKAQLLIIAVIASYSSPLLAYVGPGTGLTVIGTLIAVAAAIFLAIAGFVWFPVKRLLGKRKNKNSKNAENKEERNESEKDSKNDKE